MSRKQRITQLITDELNPVFLAVEDESAMHHVPKGAETHFKVAIVSETFENLAKITRHRLINNLLAGELNAGLHALSLHLYTPEEWKGRDGGVGNSPACRDGYRQG
jgi:BolA family transcriptional regulator, general stress-responsive regulator